MAIEEPDDETSALSHAVLGAAIEVHRLLGPGFLERVYERALCIELALRKIPFERQREFEVHYKGECVGEGRLDLLVGDRLVVELKAIKEVPHVDVIRTVSYLRSTDLLLALIINFDVPVLRDGVQRVVASRRGAAV